MVNSVDISAATRELMLRMGQDWYQQGEVHQAMDIYLRVVEEYPGTAEAESAQFSLLKIAQYYETEDVPRLSLDVLERLNRATVPTL